MIMLVSDTLIVLMAVVMVITFIDMRTLSAVITIAVNDRAIVALR